MADEVMDLGAEAELDLGTETEVEVAEPGTEVEAEPVEGSPEAVSAANTWKQVKERLKDSPDLHRQVKKALHFMEDAQKRIPDGIVKAQERLGLIAQLDDDPDDPEYVPGSRTMEEVVSNIKAELGFWRDFNSAVAEGSQGVVDHIVDRDPAGFQKMMPYGMDRYAEVNPEGFSTYICKSVSGYLQNAQIPLQLMRLEDVLPPNSEDRNLQVVINAFNAIKGVINQIETSAKAKVEVKQGEQPAEAEGSKDSDSLELSDYKFGNEARTRSESFMVSEVQRIAPGKRFTPDEVSSIRTKVKTEIDARCRVNTEYQKKLIGMAKAKNKAGYGMTVESEHKKIIPGAVKRAVDDVLAKRSGQVKKPAMNGSGKTQVTQSIAPGVNNQQFEWIADSPARLGLKIDFRRGGIQPDNSAFIVGRAKPVKWKQKK